MHAYLIIGRSEKTISEIIESLAAKTNSNVLEFPLIKIGDVRSLDSYLKLKSPTPTLIVCQNIQNATTEALNAFLKRLEEPGENISFVLTSPSVNMVLSTVVSRCQIIYAASDNKTISAAEADVFIKMKTGERLLFTDKIKSKADAIEFIQSLLDYTYDSINTGAKNYFHLLNCSDYFQKSLENIKGNGNISLHLTNLVARMDSE